MSEAARSPRDRYREQVRDEVKAHAWTQVATAGATALSVNAIAKQMGISGPALYRYFRNRDDLITELVLDAYRDLVETCRAAVAGGGPAPARLGAMAAALRSWALAAPHRYLLIYGTPVPGYQAPPEATELAGSVMALLLDAFGEADGADGAVSGAAAAFDRHLDAHRQWAEGHPASAEALRRALTFWTRLHGVVSLEVAGHFAGMGFDPALLYAAEVDAAMGGLRKPPDLHEGHLRVRVVHRVIRAGRRCSAPAVTGGRRGGLVRLRRRRALPLGGPTCRS